MKWECYVRAANIYRKAAVPLQRVRAGLGITYILLASSILYLKHLVNELGVLDHVADRLLKNDLLPLHSRLPMRFAADDHCLMNDTTSLSDRARSD